MPHRRPPEPVGQPRALSREVIVDVAMRILDAEGLDAVTMRRVALDLDTGPASLYAHVRDKRDLYAALVDRVIGEIPVPEPDPARWQEQLKEVFRQTRTVFGRHRDIARAALGVIPVSESALPAVDRLLGIVLAGGVSRQVAAWALDITNLYVTATAFEESLEDFTAGGIADPHHHAELETFFAALPAADFPNLVAMAGPLTTGDRDDRFEFGLDMLIRGIASTTSAPDGAAAVRSRPGKSSPVPAAGAFLALPGSHVAVCQPDDVAELVVLQRCCWVQEAISNGTLDIPALHETPAEVARWATEWTTLVVRQQGRLVAAVRGRQEHADWQVGRLMVAPDLAGHGVGSALLHIIEQAAPDGVDRFILFTGAKSMRNIRTYERAGYRLAPVPEQQGPGHVAGAVYLIKSR